MKLTGKVVNGKNEPQPFIKVFISDKDSNITPLKYGALTDENGNYSIEVPEKSTYQAGVKTFNVDGNFISITEAGFPLAKQKLIDGETVYNFDTSIKMYNTPLDEIIITGKREVKEPIKAPVKKSIKAPVKKSYWWIIPVSIGVLLIAGGVYYAVKRK
jgi:hypothetical protein